MSLVVCILIAENLSRETWLSLQHLHLPSGTRIITPAKPQPVHVARNGMTEEVLRLPSEFDHVLWIDSDMEFPPDAVDRLLAHDVDIVGGLCHSRHFPYAPTTMRLFGEAFGFEVPTLGVVYDFDGDLLEVDATGAAFLLVKRSVFERLGTSCWWDPIDGSNEDIAFCSRAREAGLKLHVDTSLDIGHKTQIILNSATAKKLRPFEWQRWAAEPPVPSSDVVHPSVSVLIPVTSQVDLKLLKAAIITAAGQSVPCEVVVSGPEKLLNVLDPKFISSYRCKVQLLEEGATCGTALAAALLVSKGEWISILLPTDLYALDRCENLLQAAERFDARAVFHQTQTSVNGGGFMLYDPAVRWVGLQEQREALAAHPYIRASSIMVHNGVLARVGGFDEGLDVHVLWDLAARVAAIEPWFQVEKILGTVRVQTPHPVDLVEKATAEAAQIRNRYGGQVDLSQASV